MPCTSDLDEVAFAEVAIAELVGHGDGEDGDGGDAHVERGRGAVLELGDGALELEDAGFEGGGGAGGEWSKNRVL